MKALLLLIPLALSSCDKDEPAPSQASDDNRSPQSTQNTSSPSPESGSPTKSSRPREITERSKRIPTGKWHPEKKGHVISPHTGEIFFAIGVISSSKMSDSEGNEFLIPDFSESPITKYPTGAPISGKPGYVINPFTGVEVDARGVPPGLLIRDPKDPNHDNKFRTPHP